MMSSILAQSSDLRTIGSCSLSSSLRVRSISPKTEAVILKAMAEKLTDRFQTAAEMKQALHSPDDVPLPIGIPKRNPPQAQPYLTGEKTFGIMALVFGTVLVVALIAVGIFSAMRGGPSQGTATAQARSSQVTQANATATNLTAVPVQANATSIAQAQATSAAQIQATMAAQWNATSDANSMAISARGTEYAKTLVTSQANATATALARASVVASIPQECGMTNTTARYGPIALGSNVILGKHRSVDGSTNWNDTMDSFVGKVAKVTTLDGVDSQGCPGVRVDMDSSRWFWRIRDLTFSK